MTKTRVIFSFRLMLSPEDRAPPGAVAPRGPVFQTARARFLAPVTCAFTVALASELVRQIRVHAPHLVIPTDWQWLTELAGKRPLATSAFGDVFLQGDDGAWFLDTVEGKLSREWDSPGSLHAQLNTAAGQDRYLMAGLAVAASNTGLVPGDRQVL